MKQKYNFYDLKNLFYCLLEKESYIAAPCITPVVKQSHSSRFIYICSFFSVQFVLVCYIVYFFFREYKLIVYRLTIMIYFVITFCFLSAGVFLLLFLINEKKY